MKNKSDQHLVWLDLEMTGLDPSTHRIIEIATIITDQSLHIVAEGPVVAIHQPQSELDKMDEWNQTHHGDSGLIERVIASTATEHDAEQATLNFIKEYVDPDISPLCGNSIAQDRRFLRRYMPSLNAHFHYRNLDVSTVKILSQYWYPKIAKRIKKVSQHIALEDIKDSIEELKYYREHVFVEHDE